MFRPEGLRVKQVPSSSARRIAFHANKKQHLAFNVEVNQIDYKRTTCSTKCQAQRLVKVPTTSVGHVLGTNILHHELQLVKLLKVFGNRSPFFDSALWAEKSFSHQKY
jgi:hypothetical protein